MMQATCILCGERFWRDYDEEWKRLCLPCWKAKKNKVTPSHDPCEIERLRAQIYALEAMRDALQEELLRLQDLAHIGAVVQERAKDFLFLVHPDKHGGDHRALEISQWINGEVRNG